MNSIIKTRIPEINSLLRRLQHDSHWKDFRLVYNYFDKITKKFINELLENIPEKQEDYRLYLIDFIIRTRRIFSSIVLLALYGKLLDMHILYRPLLENIVQTKIFLKGRRAKSVRAINLYRLIRKLKEQKNTIKYSLQDNDIDMFFEEPVCNYFEKIKKLEEELTKYYEEEILKMEKKVDQGLSWHGRSIKAAIRECNLVDGFEDYDESCRFLHVRDYGLIGIGDYFKDNNYTKMKLFRIAVICICHLDDFKQVCPNSFLIKTKNNDRNDYIMILAKLMGKILYNISPEFKESIDKLNLKSIQ